MTQNPINDVIAEDLKCTQELHLALIKLYRMHPQAWLYERLIIRKAEALLKANEAAAELPWFYIFERCWKDMLAATTERDKEIREAVIDEVIDHLKSIDPMIPNGPETPGMIYVEPLIKSITQLKQGEEEPQSFTRKQIGKMSLAEFLKNEAAINEAIKKGLIHD